MSRNLTGPPYTAEEMAQRLPEPDPDNVDALAEAVSRFHNKLDASLGEDLIAAATLEFAIRTLDRASIVVHFTADGER